MQTTILTILQCVLKKLNAVKYGSIDGESFEFKMFISRPNGANWPPLCHKYKYYLLNPLCKFNNKIIKK